MPRKPPKTTPALSLKPVPTRNPDLPATLEGNEIPSNVRESEITGLTHRQKSVLPILAVTHTLAQAARDSGVSEKTLRRWMDDPTFRTELDHLREESYDIARQQFQIAVPLFISVLTNEALENPDPSIRIRAARYGLNYAVKFRDYDKLVEDVQDLRAALLNRN